MASDALASVEVLQVHVSRVRKHRQLHAEAVRDFVELARTRFADLRSAEGRDAPAGGPAPADPSAEGGDRSLFLPPDLVEVLRRFEATGRVPDSVVHSATFQPHKWDAMRRALLKVPPLSDGAADPLPLDGGGGGGAEAPPRSFDATLRLRARLLVKLREAKLVGEADFSAFRESFRSRARLKKAMEEGADALSSAEERLVALCAPGAARLPDALAALPDAVASAFLSDDEAASVARMAAALRGAVARGVADADAAAEALLSASLEAVGSGGAARSDGGTKRGAGGGCWPLLALLCAALAPSERLRSAFFRRCGALIAEMRHWHAMRPLQRAAAVLGAVAAMAAEAAAAPPAGALREAAGRLFARVAAEERAAPPSRSARCRSPRWPPSSCSRRARAAPPRRSRCRPASRPSRAGRGRSARSSGASRRPRRRSTAPKRPSAPSSPRRRRARWSSEAPRRCRRPCCCARRRRCTATRTL